MEIFTWVLIICLRQELLLVTVITVTIHVLRDRVLVILCLFLLLDSINIDVTSLLNDVTSVIELLLSDRFRVLDESENETTNLGPYWDKFTQEVHQEIEVCLCCVFDFGF